MGGGEGGGGDGDGGGSNGSGGEGGELQQPRFTPSAVGQQSPESEEHAACNVQDDDGGDGGGESPSHSQSVSGQNGGSL